MKNNFCLNISGMDLSFNANMLLVLQTKSQNLVEDVENQLEDLINLLSIRLKAPQY